MGKRAWTTLRCNVANVEAVDKFHTGSKLAMDGPLSPARR